MNTATKAEKDAAEAALIAARTEDQAAHTYDEKIAEIAETVNEVIAAPTPETVMEDIRCADERIEQQTQLIIDAKAKIAATEERRKKLKAVLRKLIGRM